MPLKTIDMVTHVVKEKVLAFVVLSYPKIEVQNRTTSFNSILSNSAAITFFAKSSLTQFFMGT